MDQWTHGVGCWSHKRQPWIFLQKNFLCQVVVQVDPNTESFWLRKYEHLDQRVMRMHVRNWMHVRILLNIQVIQREPWDVSGVANNILCNFPLHCQVISVADEGHSLENSSTKIPLQCYQTQACLFAVKDWKYYVHRSCHTIWVSYVWLNLKDLTWCKLARDFTNLWLKPRNRFFRGILQSQEETVKWCKRNQLNDAWTDAWDVLW